MSKVSVLILQHTVSAYNIPMYELLSEMVNLTVGYTRKNESNKVLPFNVKKLKSYLIGPFVFVPCLHSFCSNFDVVIYMPDMHFISYIMLCFLKRKYKLISWSIGIRASYSLRYDLDRPMTLLDRCFKLLLKKSDANIFYMKEPIAKWSHCGIDKSKLFVAHNTVAVNSIEIDSSFKKTILFVGSLYKEKKVDELIEAYETAFLEKGGEEGPILNIIGEGPEKVYLVSLLKQKGLEKQIILRGAIYDETVIAEYFKEALICVSPDQAGLSVLKSMGYGVPFITKKDAITGGEILNIENNKTGRLYQHRDELVKILQEVAEFPQKYIEMGILAMEYYKQNASISQMVQGFYDAISFVQIDNQWKN